MLLNNCFRRPKMTSKLRSFSTNLNIVPNVINGTLEKPDTNLIENTDPATGEVFGLIPNSTDDDVDRAVRTASDAFHGPWSNSTLGSRASLLRAIADSVESRLDEFAEAESRDTGKPFTLAKQLDIPRAVANFRFFADYVQGMQSGCNRMPQHLNYTDHSPVGVVGLVTPWNLPLYLLTWKLAPALAMGNTIVAKPSEVTPQTASLLAQVALDAGLPAGVFNVVHGEGRGAGQALVSHSLVQAVSFTGGTATGAVVAASAASSFKKLSLELGGKNPTIVFADADFEAAVEGVARSAFLNSGQICLCGTRILVERSIYDRFAAALATKTKALRVGPPNSSDSDMGPVVSRAQRDKVESYYALAREEGGSFLAGGHRVEVPAPYDQGYYLAPTIVAGLPHSSRTVQEEIFGPMVTIHPFDGEEEAVRLANDVRYGLAASVWTQDLARAHRVSGLVQAGMVWVNCWLVRDLRTPFGGMKDSGVGREGGQLSLDFYSEKKNVCIALDMPSNPIMGRPLC